MVSYTLLNSPWLHTNAFLLQLLNYLGDLIINGRSVVGAVGPEPKPVELVMPQVLDNKEPCTKGLRNILKKQGPKAFADVR